MTRVIAGLLAIAWAWAGWRNMPRLSDASSIAAGASIAASVLIAFYLGTKLKRDSAIATAVASAQATALAQVTAQTTSHVDNKIQIVLANGARQRGSVLGMDDAPWMVGTHRQVEFDDTEALDSMMLDVQEDRTDTG